CKKCVRKLGVDGVPDRWPIQRDREHSAVGGRDHWLILVIHVSLCGGVRRVTTGMDGRIKLSTPISIRQLPTAAQISPDTGRCTTSVGTSRASATEARTGRARCAATA